MNKIIVRSARKEDLKFISVIHTKCFPDSFLTSLATIEKIIDGSDLISLFYKEFFEDNPELFVVAEDSNYGIVGYCMGYYMDKDYQMKNFIKHNRFELLYKTCILLLKGNRAAWMKVLARLNRNTDDNVWRIVDNRYETLGNDLRGDLLSICVLPDFRGKGYAQELITSYLTKMRLSGRKLCLLSVRTDNVRARRFYEKNGFELYRTRGKVGLTYIKLLY